MTASALRSASRAPAGSCRTRRIRPSSSTRDELQLPEPICRLLVARGYGAPEHAKRYLRPRLDQLLTTRAAARSRSRGRAARARHPRRRDDSRPRRLRRRRHLLDHAAGAHAPRARRQGRAVHSAPPRDGYDLTDAGVRAAQRMRARRSSSPATAARARSRPIADAAGRGHRRHRQRPPPPGRCRCRRRTRCSTPSARAVASPDKDLAAVGVAFKLALALTRALGGNENVVYGMLDLVALATIADVAPLRGENRVLRALRAQAAQRDAERPGIRALIRAAGLEGKPLTAGRVGFILAPRLNAVGRLGQRAARRRAADVARTSTRRTRSRASSRS